MLDRKSANFEYCTLNDSFNDKDAINDYIVHIDFGANTKLKSDNSYNDIPGENAVFNPMIDAMKLIDKPGWELVKAYAITPTNSRSSNQWIRKRK